MNGGILGWRKSKAWQVWEDFCEVHTYYSLALAVTGVINIFGPMWNDFVRGVQWAASVVGSKTAEVTLPSVLLLAGGLVIIISVINRARH